MYGPAFHDLLCRGYMLQLHDVVQLHRPGLLLGVGNGLHRGGSPLKAVVSTKGGLLEEGWGIGNLRVGLHHGNLVLVGVAAPPVHGAVQRRVLRLHVPAGLTVVLSPPSPSSSSSSSRMCLGGSLRRGPRGACSFFPGTYSTSSKRPSPPLPANPAPPSPPP